MPIIEPELDLAVLLIRYEGAGGTLDYVFEESDNLTSAFEFHRAAALAGMAELDRRLVQHAIRNVSEEFPIDAFYRLHWNEELLRGEQVSIGTFWGADNADPDSFGKRDWYIDGYKKAFFHPVHFLQGTVSENEELFAGINSYVLGDDPERAEIFSWSTDWSDYFNAGHEWWGEFYWTIQSAGSNQIAVIGASDTD
jgi:hypothetical protein